MRFEELHSNKTFENYTYKVVKELNMSKEEAESMLLSELFIVFSKNEDKDEKYYFMKAYRNLKDQYLEEIGRSRYWNSDTKQKERIISVEYESEKDKREHCESIEEDDFDYDLNEAFEILENDYTKNQVEFAKLIIENGAEMAKEILGMETRVFNQKLDRLIKAAEKKNLRVD